MSSFRISFQIEIHDTIRPISNVELHMHRTQCKLEGTQRLHASGSGLLGGVSTDLYNITGLLGLIANDLRQVTAKCGVSKGYFSHCSDRSPRMLAQVLLKYNL